MRHYYRGTNLGYTKNKAKKRRKFFNISKKRYREYEASAAVNFYNPFKIRTRSSMFKIKMFSAAAIIFIWLVLLVYSQYFRISDVKITGNKIILTEAINDLVNKEFSARSKIIPQNNYFFVSNNSIKEKIVNNLPVNDAQVKKVFPNQLLISIQEKTSGAIFDDGENYYLVGNDGVVLDHLRSVTKEEYATSTMTNPAPLSASSTEYTHEPNAGSFAAEYPDLNIIYLKKNSSTNIFISEANREPVLKSETIKAVNGLSNALKRGSELKIRYFSLTNDEIDGLIISDKPWVIKFSTTHSIDEQIKAFTAVSKVAEPKKYIDLRVEGRVFWK